MITIHEAKAADFTTLGLGALLPSECTVRERAGGMYELKIVHPITEDGRHHRIKPMRIIKAPAPVRETPLVEIDQTGTVARDIYKVVTGGMRLNMRADADIESKVIHAYKPGTEVCKLGATGDWMQVAVLDGGATGWMWAENLEYVRTETDAIIGDAPGTVVRPRQTREQLFRIYRYSPDSKERAVTAEARHITYDLAGAVVEGEYSPKNVPANQVCAQIMARADHDVSDFHIYCTVSTPISGEYGGRNILDCLLDPETGIVAQAKARIVRDNYDIFILPDEVRSRGVDLRYGKNLLSAYMDTDVSDTITRIKPVGKTRDGEKLYIEENGGWVESPYISDYPVVYSKEVEYDVVESDELPIDQARALLKEKAEADFMAGCDMATVKLDADFVRLELTEDYKHLANQYALHLYDSVPVIDRDADIVATARMTEYAYDAIIDEYQDTGLGELEEVGSTIYGYELAAGSVSGGKLIPNTVHGDRLQNLSISYGKFDLAAIKLLSADAIVAIRADVRELVAGNITTDQLYADIAVIAAAQITAANIDKANIKWAEIESLTAEIAKIVNAEIGHAEIDTAQIKNLSAAVATIVKAEIAIAEIDWARIKNVEVDTAQIKLGAITSALIAAGAIGTAQIADGSITEAKIVSLNADVITSGTLSTERLLIKGEGGLFYEINATAGGLTAAQLTEEQYKNAISGTALVARSVTADKIAAKSITSNEILSGTITAAEINVANLFAAEATIAALDSYIMRTTTIEALKGSLDIWASDKINLAVKNVQIGGTNMVRLTDGYITFLDGNGAVARDWPKTHYCQGGVGMGMYPPKGDYNLLHFTAPMAIAPGEYILSFWSWLGGDTDIQPTIQCNLFSSSAGVDHYFGSCQPPKYTPTRYVMPITVDYTAEVTLRILCFTPSFTTGQVYFTDFKLEKGTKATDWSPAPEDTDAAIDKLSAELVIQAGDITANATKIETVNQAAANAQNAANAAQSTANGAVTRVTTAEGRISAVEGSISSMVTEEEFNELGEKVSANSSEITQTAREIRSEVASSVSGLQTQIGQTDKQVLILAGRTVGGTNMIRNTGTLKTANYAFDSSGASALGSWTEDEFGGFHVVCNNANVRCWMGEYAVTPGQSYAMSVRYKINSGNSPIQFQYVLKSAGGDALYYWESVNHSTTSTITEDGWTVLRSVFAVPNDPAVGKVSIAIRTGLDGALYTVDYNIRRPKFEAGSMPTDWSPSPDDPAGSVDAGGVVRVDQTGVHMSGGTIEMETSDGDEYIYIKNSGITASSLSAPNVAKRYDGPAVIWINPEATSDQIAGGSVYRSLKDLFARLNGRMLDLSELTVHMQGNDYGVMELARVVGGVIRIYGNGVTLTGGLSIADCAARIHIENMNFAASGVNQAAWAFGKGVWVQWKDCTFNGGGAGYCLFFGDGANGMVWSCGLYNAVNLMYVGHACDVSALGLKGGGGTNFLASDGCTIKLSGTRPDGAWAQHNSALIAPADPSALAIDYGTAQPGTPTIQTAEFVYLHSDSYRGGWQWFSDEDVRQGYISSGTIYGVIWFDAAAIRSALNGRTINRVSLRLHMHKGVGRGSAVSVQLYGSDISYDRTAAPGLVTSYGTIGTTEPDTVSEITIPTQVIADILSGTIQALVLKSDDAELYKDRDYSRNYAKFSGSTTATAENCPRLTVVYQ